MKKTIVLICACLAQLGFAQEKHWGYEGMVGPEYWATLHGGEECGMSRSQSPIDVNTTEVKKDKKIKKVIFKYADSRIQSIEDNGHSIQFDFADGGHIIYDTITYDLVQFHAHEKSEHTIDGMFYPLELHFVHQSEDGRLLVIAVLVKEGEENKYFNKLNEIKGLAKNGHISTSIPFNPQKLYPKKKTFYTYLGSLTTPPCSDNVTWIIFKDPITMQKKDIEELGEHLPKSNARPVQPLNGRVVYQK